MDSILELNNSLEEVEEKINKYHDKAKVSTFCFLLSIVFSAYRCFVW